MKKLLSAVGFLALLAWTAVGILVWKDLGQRAEQMQESASAGDQRLALLADDVASLHADLKGLTETLNGGLGGLADSLAQGSEDRAAAQAKRMDALAAAVDRIGQELAVSKDEPAFAEFGARLDRIAALLEEGKGPAPEGLSSDAPAEASPEPSEPVPAVADSGRASPAEPAVVEVHAEPAPTVEPSPAPTHRSFLSFQLPSDDFHFDELRRWRILTDLSRVGFDGSSTIHDFSGASSEVEGTFDANPAHPGDGLDGSISFPVASMTTGLAGRDDEMMGVLDAEQFPMITLTLSGFDATKVDGEGQAIEGTVHGTMTIRGATHPVDVPVTIQLDSGHRLLIEGETPLDLTDFKVPVPNKAGLIKMDKEVHLWVSLRARAMARKAS